MNSIRQVQRLNDAELEKCVPSNASWHTDYRDTAYIYIGGLPFDLSEGDVLTIFSQYGNPVHINLIRDKETGKSRGFCFLKYEDQRSCDLAVDNLSGAGVMGKVLSVDHTRYKKKDGEIERVADDEEEPADETDREGDGRRKRRRTESRSESEEERPMIKEEIELARLLREHDDDDPMKAYLVKEKKAEVQEALKAVVKSKENGEGRRRKHKHHHRARRDSDDGGDRERRNERRRRSREQSDDVEENRLRDRHPSHRDDALDDRARKPRRVRSGSGNGRDRRDRDGGSRRDQSATPPANDERGYRSQNRRKVGSRPSDHRRRWREEDDRSRSR